jgi:hypothetical protein
VVSANSGEDEKHAPRPGASRNRAINRRTSEPRLLAEWIGPGWATAVGSLRNKAIPLSTTAPRRACRKPPLARIGATVLADSAANLPQNPSGPRSG